MKAQKLCIQGDLVSKMKLIGQGNFSQVFYAETQNGKKAAIKKVKKSVKDKTSYQLAKREASIMTNLHSASVTELKGTFQEHNYYYIIQRFQEGQPLDVILKKRKRLPIGQAEQIFKNILKGVQYLMTQKVMHRDLKPSNIICDDRQQTSLIDFGFACKIQSDDALVLTERIGTPFYMSPEMLKRTKYNSKSDIWSLGVIFYEMICGYLPYFGANDGDLLKDIMTGGDKLFKTEKHVSERIMKLIRRCLTVDVNERISWSQLFTEEKLSSSSVFRGDQIIYEQTSVFSGCCSLF